MFGAYIFKITTPYTRCQWVKSVRSLILWLRNNDMVLFMKIWCKATASFDWLFFLPQIMSFTHWGRDKMAAVTSQTTFSNEFSWMKMYEYRLRFHWSLFLMQGPINNIPALVQIMAWRRPGDKPLSGPMMVRLPTHICVTRPQWVKGEK